MATAQVTLWTLLLLLPILILVMGFFPRKNHFILQNRTILITGGSQGLGLAAAKLCAQKGANVIIVARNTDKLKAAVQVLGASARSNESRSSQRFHYISADVTLPEENIRLLAEAVEWNGGSPPDIVWANAGSAYPHLFIETPVEKLRAQMDIDYWAAAYLSHCTLKLWTQSSVSNNKNNDFTATLPRHLIITSSVVAFVGLAGYAPYSPAKAALRNLSDTLRNEIQVYNGARLNGKNPSRIPEIRNHILFPGGILSPGLEEENKVKHPVTVMLEADDKPQTEDEVARAAIKELERGDYLITTALLGSLMKAGALGGSPRNGLGIFDTLLGCLSTIIWRFVGPDLENKVLKWGKANFQGQALSTEERDG